MEMPVFEQDEKADCLETWEWQEATLQVVAARRCESNRISKVQAV